MLKKMSFLVVSLCFGTEIVAQPSVSDVSNEFVTQSSELQIVIEGSRFGEGPKVLFYMDLDDVDDGTPLSEVKPEVGKTTFGYRKPEVGTYQKQKGFFLVDEETKEYSITGVDLGDTYSDVFFSYSVAIPEGRTAPSQSTPRSWGGSTWKFAWLLEEDGANSNLEKFDMCIPTQVGDNTSYSGNSSKFKKIDGDGVLIPTKKSEWWAWDRFNHISGWIDKNNEDYRDTNGNFSTVNGDFGFRNNHMDEGVYLFGPEPNVSLINFPGWVRKSDEDDFQAIYTNLYVAGGENHKARVELTDSADYEESTYRKVLHPSSWTDSRIETSVHSNITSLQGNLYVHVFDANNVRSSAGTLACKVCPSMQQ